MKNTTDKLGLKDILGNCLCRWGLRHNYKVPPGLYALGKPDEKAWVFVSANYKFSFDELRKNLKGLQAWILVLDTKGINVWCAAGKGTFGTEELIRQIKETNLKNKIAHQQLIVPQLGATGIAAYEIKKQTGLEVIYGPVQAKDIQKFLKIGLKATKEMRRIKFTFYDRLVLVPMEFIMGLNYLLIAASLMFLLSGFWKGSFSLVNIMKNGLIEIMILLLAYCCGTVFGPLLLPYIPGRSFAFKGLILGLVLSVTLYLKGWLGTSLWIIWAWMISIPVISSFFTMNFTGSSTYTSISGVLKEMKVALPLQMIGITVGCILWIISRFI
jgi:hypothetical protein